MVEHRPDLVRLVTVRTLALRFAELEGDRRLAEKIAFTNEPFDRSFLVKLSKLEYLHVDGEQLNLGDDFLQLVSKLKRLKTLRIVPQSNFSDEGIAELASLQNLKELSLSSSLITDRSLRTIGELKELRILYLASPRLTDDAAEHLSNLRKFQEITAGSFHRTNVEINPKKQGDEQG